MSPLGYKFAVRMASFERLWRGHARVSASPEKAEVLETGGTALIFKKPLSHSISVVEKVLLPKYQGDPDFESLQRQEFKILQDLHHPFLPKAYGIEFETSRWGRNTHIVQMEYVDGFNLVELHDYLESLKPELRQTWANRLLQQLCSVLKYLHSRSIIHGDLAPVNIMVDRAGYIKLLDFGVARREGEGLRFKISGRAFFRAPELVQSGESSVNGDRFALGKIYEWALGDELAQKAENKSRIQQMTEARIWPKELAPSNSEWFEPLSPLPTEIQRSSVSTGPKTIVEKKKGWAYNLLRPAFFGSVLLLLFPFLITGLPQRGTLTINTLPISRVRIESLDPHQSFETPITGLRVPAGMTVIRFTIPSMRNRQVVRQLQVTAAEEAKLFEDFRNLDTLEK